jgi:hypothetical protein
MQTSVIKIYHSFEGNLDKFRDFLMNLGKLFKGSEIKLGVHVSHGQYFYTADTDERDTPGFENLFYTHFPKFQLTPDTGFVWNYTPETTVIGDITLENGWFFPFKDIHEEFITQIFRSFDGCDPATERGGLVKMTLS